MSGGFFRGTSSEQDTRFSNKQAKLMKSQKFAPELEHMVDMTKVTMDVIRPWIAKRVTELIGFEDEVLINFIYGLLEGKEVNGKEIQISITGFMEKNTVKFMKELWTLLLSAQKNTSGVPQQFLDAKEEETKKKKAEADLITTEIQKKIDKESREYEQERSMKMEDGVEMKTHNADGEQASRNMPPRSSSVLLEDDKGTNKRNGFSGRSRASPSRSGGKSLSRSRSRSRSSSRSRGARGRSKSLERVYRSPRRRSSPPRRRNSPAGSISPRRRSSYYMRRSRSPSRRRTPPKEWRRMRSPYNRSPSPAVRRHRSPSPIQRRRSPSPIRHRSPFRKHRRSPSSLYHGSPSPVWRGNRSPIRHRPSPSARRRSPIAARRRSPSPIRRQSHSSVRRRSPSPRRRRLRSPLTPPQRSISPAHKRALMPVQRESPTLPQGRYRSPYESSSPSPARRMSSSPVRRRYPVEHKRSRKESPRERISNTMRSPPEEHKNDRGLRDKSPALSPSPESEDRIRRSLPDGRSPMQNKQPVIHNNSSYLEKRRGQESGYRSPETGIKDCRRDVDPESKSVKKLVHTNEQDSFLKALHNAEYSLKRSVGRPADEKADTRTGVQVKKSEKVSENARLPEISDCRLSSPLYTEEKQPTVFATSVVGDDQRLDESDCPLTGNVKESGQLPKSQSSMLVEKAPKNNTNGSYDSSSGVSEHKSDKREKRKHKRSKIQEVASEEEYSSDSIIEDTKEVKRKKKEEKKLRKEEKRRRREERRRKKEQRRAEKRKAKSQDAVGSSEDEYVQRKTSHASDLEATESEQKKLEMELRNKALESLKAKKGIGQ